MGKSRVPRSRTTTRGEYFLDTRLYARRDSFSGSTYFIDKRRHREGRIRAGRVARRGLIRIQYRRMLFHMYLYHAFHSTTSAHVDNLVIIYRAHLL